MPILSDKAIFAEGVTGDSARDEAVAEYLESHTLVFVGGFLNEIARFPVAGSYFRQNIRAVRRTGEGVRACKVFPPSSRRIDENVTLLVERFSEAFEKGGRRPLTIIGHSKGGAEVLLALLGHPDLILGGPVDHVVLVQAAIGGSPLADGIAEPRRRQPLPALLSVAGRLIRWRYRPGLLSLRTADADRVFETALAEARRRLDAESFARLGGRLFYIRSAQDPACMKRRVRILAEFLSALGHDPNDGIVPLDDQKLDGLGIDLGEVLSATHTDLVCSGFAITRRGRRYREAFTLLMLKALATAGSG